MFLMFVFGRRFAVFYDDSVATLLFVIRDIVWFRGSFVQSFRDPNSWPF